MENLKLRHKYEQKLLEYYTKVGDQNLLDEFAVFYGEKNWRTILVGAMAVTILEDIENKEEFALNQIKVLDELINEK